MTTVNNTLVDYLPLTTDQFNQLSTTLLSSSKSSMENRHEFYQRQLSLVEQQSGASKIELLQNNHNLYDENVNNDENGEVVVVVPYFRIEANCKYSIQMARALLKNLISKLFQMHIMEQQQQQQQQSEENEENGNVAVSTGEQQEAQKEEEVKTIFYGEDEDVVEEDVRNVRNVRSDTSDSGGHSNDGNGSDNSNRPERQRHMPHISTFNMQSAREMGLCTSAKDSDAGGCVVM